MKDRLYLYCPNFWTLLISYSQCFHFLSVYYSSVYKQFKIIERKTYWKYKIRIATMLTFALFGYISLSRCLSQSLYSTGIIHPVSVAVYTFGCLIYLLANTNDVGSRWPLIASKTGFSVILFLNKRNNRTSSHGIFTHSKISSISASTYFFSLNIKIYEALKQSICLCYQARIFHLFRKVCKTSHRIRFCTTLVLQIWYFLLFFSSHFNWIATFLTNRLIW